MTTTPCAAPEQRAHSHYFKDITHLDWLDIYRVCALYITNDPSGALAHAAKKILVAGGRGAKDIRKDIQEAIDTLQRKLEMLDEDEQRDQPMHVGVDPASGPDMTIITALGGGGGGAADTGGARVVGGFHSAIQDLLVGGLGIARIDPADIFKYPHAELRKTWAPGQRWQTSHDGVKWGEPFTAQPKWWPNLKYRRHPDDVAPPKPWYPDENTDWVEVSNDLTTMPAALRPSDFVEFLFRCEREAKFYIKGYEQVCRIVWHRSPKNDFRIVAYRTIQKAAKND